MKNLLLLSICLISQSLLASNVNYLDTDYKFFDTHDEAVNYAFEDYSEYIPIDGRPGLYQNVEKVLDTVFQKMQNIYPREGLRRPFVLINNAGSNYTSSTWELENNEHVLKQMNYIKISEEMAENEDLLYWVLTHELAHYFIADKGFETKDEVKVVYDPANTDCIDCLFNSDKAFGGKTLDDFVKLREQWLEISSGALIDEYEYPVTPYFSGGLVEELFIDFITRASSTEEEKLNACLERINNSSSDSDNDEPGLFELLQYRLDQTNHLMILSEEELNMTNKALNESMNKMMKCLDDRLDLLLPSLDAVYGSKYVWVDKTHDDNGDLINANPLKMIRDKFLKEKQRYSDMLAEAPELGNLFYLSHEDEADELAAKTLYFTDYKDTSIEAYLGSNETEIKRCKANIQKGLFYQGFIDDDHHSNCFRYWRVKKIYESMDKKYSTNLL